jgi:hypothetical protein
MALVHRGNIAVGPRSIEPEASLSAFPENSRHYIITNIYKSLESLESFGGSNSRSVVEKPITLLLAEIQRHDAG